MPFPRAKPPQRLGSDRGAILLLDDAPQIRTARAEHLMRRGFQVKLASALEQAEALWQPNRYVLVLFAVTRNVRRTADLCERIKLEHPQQIVGMLVPPTADLPSTRFPDVLWPEESLDYFLARVETLADFASAA